MIDIHSHILPGIDDGPAQMEEAIQMARIAAADGITEMIATPHVNDHFPAIVADAARQRAGFEPDVAAFNQHLRAVGLDLMIRPGAEIAYAQIDDADLTVLGMNGTRYVLIEFPHTHLPINAAEVIFKLVINGYRPIVAHPERNPSVIDNPKKLMVLRERGALAQLTAASLTRANDPDIRQCARYLVKKGAVDFIATDAHSAGSRPPTLSAARDMAAKQVGTQRAAALVSGNPLALLKGEPIVRLDR